MNADKRMMQNKIALLSSKTSFRTFLVHHKAEKDLFPALSFQRACEKLRSLFKFLNKLAQLKKIHEVCSSLLEKNYFKITT